MDLHFIWGSRIKYTQKEGAFSCLANECGWGSETSRDMAAFLPYYTMYVITLPQYFCITKFRLFSMDVFITLTHAPTCGIIVMYTMYMHYSISSKVKFCYGNHMLHFLWFCYGLLRIACDMKRNKNRTAQSSLQTPQ